VPRYRRYIDAETAEKFLKEGRGQGRGKDYQPYLKVTDFPSDGRSYRPVGLKTGREHECFSTEEFHEFLIEEWSDDVVDLREQFPLLPLSETMQLAERHKLKHPTHPYTHKPVVMTTDLLLTIKQDKTTIEVARAIKLTKDLNSRRTQVKLEIEALYWDARHVDWGIITERDISKDYAENIRVLRTYRTIADRVSLSQQDIDDIVQYLLQLVTSGTVSLAAATASCDRALGYERGTSLTVAHHLLATKRWHIDLYQPFEPEKPFRLLDYSKP